MSTSKTTATRKSASTSARKTTTKTAAKSPAKTEAKTEVKTTPKTTKKPVSGAVDSALEAAKALSAGRKSATESKAEPVASESAAIDADASEEMHATLRKKEFVDAVARRSGVKRGDAKTAVEAALAELGEAIASGRNINLPGFGKLKLNRSKHLANAEVFVAKIRQPKSNDNGAAQEPGADAPKDPLAEAAE